MNQNRQRITTAVTAAALLMSTFTAMNLNAESNRGTTRISDFNMKAAGMERVTVPGVDNVRPILYGVTAANVANGNDVVTVLKKHRTAIDKISQETTKTFAGVMFGIPYQTAVSLFTAMGAGKATADAVIDEVGFTLANGEKMLTGWTLLPSVAALVLEKNGRSDISVAKILNGKFDAERFSGILAGRKAEIQRYAASLGYLSDVYVEADTLGDKCHAFGFGDVEAMSEAFTRHAREAGYVMTSGDNKQTVSLAYGFAALLVAFDGVASASY